MNNWDKERLLRSTILAGLLTVGSFGAPALAQDSQDDADADAVQEAVESTADAIVVTGSRLRRSAYESPKPLRILTTDDAISEGLFTAADILQSSSVAAGVQFDATFTGLVTDSGPGSATINLRGLGADRTLVMLNGRRLAPAGVQGAPTRPDINLIPSGIIAQYDILLDGASSTYGSDAVAGVVNAIVRSGFEGVEFGANASVPEHGGGVDQIYNMTAGVTSDRGELLFGLEYRHRENIRRGQRDFTPCDRDIEINPTTGERREICVNGGFGSMVLDPTGAIFGFVPEYDGVGADFVQYFFDFDNGSGYFLEPVNNQLGGPGDEAIDIVTGETVLGLGSRFPYGNTGYGNLYNSNRFSDDFDLLQGVETFSGYVGGEYQLTDRINSYFEMLYSSRNSTIDQGAQQIFPSIPCTNPYIQAEPTLANSPICAGAANATAAAFGLDELVFTSYIDATGNTSEVEVSQFRAVTGFNGDLEFLIPSGAISTDGNFGFDIGNWVWDVYMSYDRSNGNTAAYSLNASLVEASIRNVSQDPVTGEITCSIDTNDLFGYIGFPDCVPLNLTDPDIYINGALPQEYLDFAGGFATNRTVVTQQLLNGSIQGDVFKLPDGTIPLFIGFEYREDRIESYNGFLITSGTDLTGYQEGNTFGTTDLMEVFFETEFPILRDREFAHELTLNASARWTEEKNFGALWTYAFNLNYLPVDWLRLRGTFGTTYKAPNLRQQFLAGQTSFASAFIDPCVASVFDDYDVADQAIIRANCLAQGADPDTLGIGGATSIPVISGGNGLDLEAETSESYTAGFVINQPWFDDFDLRFSATYYEYEIENSIVAPSAGFILNDCLVEFENQSSPFCSRITRLDTGDPGRNFISGIDASFLNSGQETAAGIDYSINFDTEFTFMERPLDLSMSARLNNSLEREEEILGVFTDYQGNFGSPDWRGDFSARLGYQDWAVTWTTDYIGEVADDDIDSVRTTAVYDFGQCVTVNDPVTGAITGVDTSTCDPIFEEGFRDLEEADAYFLHDVSVSWRPDTWSLTFGVRNVFDEEPPLVDNGEVSSTLANVPLGRGYDVFGRTFFTSIKKDF